MVSLPTLRPDLAALLLCAALCVCAGCADDDNAKQGDRPDMGAVVDMAVDRDLGKPADLGEEMGVEEPDQPADMPPVVEGREALLAVGCNPVAFEHDCFFPYPSDVFLKEGAATPTGKHVVLPEVSQLTTKRGDRVNFLVHHEADGFSHHQPIVATFRQDIDDANLTFHTDDHAATLEATSTTLLINASTGELVPHWAEVDRLTDDPAQKTLLIRTLKNLDFETRYIVAIQGLKGKDGALIETPRGFREVRDGGGESLTGVPALKTRYEAEVFPVLRDLGVEVGDVQLAWDFTTQSEQMVMGDLVMMRDDLMAKLAVTPPRVTIKAVKDLRGDSSTVALRVEGTITVPLYLEKDEVFPKLSRDAAGKVVANGTHEVPFTLQVPLSAMPGSDDFEPARLMQYGHGFFGSREEINYSFMREFANEQSYIVASVDWRGMGEPEVAELLGRLLGNKLETSLLFLNGVHQGVVNFIALSHALKTTMLEVPELKRAGKALYDPEHLYYYGISQGQILGATFLALSPHVERAVLSVGGAPFSFMMGRSNNFAAFVNVLRGKFDDVSLQQFITLSQHTFDRIDPSTYSPHLLRDRIDGGPEDRTFLMQLGYWDHSVPILAGLIYARNMGIDVLTPSPVVPYGFAGVEGPVVGGSALTLIDFNVEDPPGFYAQLPTEAQNKAVEEDVNVHEAIRRQTTSKAQINAFLRVDGAITHQCDGPCNPE